MSGIVGIVNFDGRPVDRRLLSRMTASLAFRGPDADSVWIEGQVGFGHTLLRTTFEAEHEHQPLSFDGATWIVADCRIDAREELVAKLGAKGRRASLDRPDVELILHAWHIWGEACVDHLLGDFAFAVWNASERSLFCARDHMGVKPFYYAHIGDTVIFSNTLDCVRIHPRVSKGLDDAAIADFLLFGINQNSSTTSFHDIRRLPAANTVSFSGTHYRFHTYWTVPVEPTAFKRSHESYVDEFVALLDLSIRDRVRTTDIAISMSGGIDSTGLAASVCRLRNSNMPDLHINAFTTLIPGYDDERYFADATSSHLNIPHHYRVLDDDIFDINWESTSFHTPEACVNPAFTASDQGYFAFLNSKCRVLFYGEGPDNALRYEWRAHFQDLLASNRLASAANVLRYQAVENVKNRLRNRGRRMAPPTPSSQLEPPNWLARDLRCERGQKDRLSTYESGPAAVHQIRPSGHASLQIPEWQGMFEDWDCGSTNQPLEVRHPYVDVRLLRFMLSVPAVPWCNDKHLLRRSFRNTLPPVVVNRRKSALKGDPWVDRARSAGLRRLDPHPALAQYVDLDVLQSTTARDITSFKAVTRIRALNHWLKNIDSPRETHGKEAA